MGGVTPLGYAIKDRKLVIVPEEAETVRLIFRRYPPLCDRRPRSSSETVTMLDKPFTESELLSVVRRSLARPARIP